jgi:phosphonopyruvate decarboxylase
LRIYKELYQPNSGTLIMRIDAKTISQLCYENNIHFHAGVPCSLLSPITNAIATAPNMTYINAAIEGEAIAIAAGAWLAGENSAVWIQNSGLGNTINPVTSLLQPFKIPILLVTSRRGQPGVKDEPQHELMGSITAPMLELCQVSYSLLAEEPDTSSLLDKVVTSLENRHSYSIVVDKNIVAKAPYEGDVQSKKTTPCDVTNIEDSSIDNPPSRFEYLKKVVEIFDETTPIIATTGKTGRELFTLRDSSNHFYMVGSMGYASSIGLGVALNTTKNTVIIDGDGALLMNMGTLATIGHFAPKNLIHIVIDNGQYESTGGQPTTSTTVDFAAIAAQTGYAKCFTINTADALQTTCQKLVSEGQGPYLLHVKATTETIPDLARPDVHPSEVALRFRDCITKD